MKFIGGVKARARAKVRKIDSRNIYWLLDVLEDEIGRNQGREATEP